MNAHRPYRNVFPVSLLASNRRCLIVGGGKIALRKAALMLDADADITILSPELNDGFQALSESITHLERCYKPGDEQGAFVVFAATNDTEVNRMVVERCNESDILVCSIDGSWVDGSFMTPGTVRRGDISLAISTGGRSCRRSRLVKNSLSRHLKMVENAHLLVIGTSHNYLSVTEREAFHLLGDRFDKVGGMIAHVWGVHEFALLNTCNRVELLAVVSESEHLEDVVVQLMNFDHLSRDSYYIKSGEKAFSHFAVVTAGLLSQTPGEKHIVAQVKDAVTQAKDRGWAGAMMQEWLSSALHVSKHIRNDVADLLHVREIEDLCVLYLKATCENWPSVNVLVIGAGTVGRCVVEQLLGEACKVIWCYHRNRPELPEAWSDSVKMCCMNDLKEAIPQVDGVVCATSSNKPVLHAGHALFFDQDRTNIVVDLAMPRNVDHALNELSDSIKVADLDDLKHWYRREMADMDQIFKISTDAVAEHMGMYNKLLYSFQGQNEK